VNEPLRVLDLFSGIGGISLGLERTGGFRTVAFCEIDPYCRAVLRKHWPDVPIFEDVRTLTKADVSGVDVIAGGFPCTDISSAGAKAGIDGVASGLWAELLRLVREVRPDIVFVENVADLLHRGLGRVLGDLAEIGYDAEWHCIPASEAGAPIDREGRDRVWIVAVPDIRGFVGEGLSREIERQLVARPSWGDCPVARVSGSAPYLRADQPGVLRVAHGIPHRVDRIAAIGNSVVPQVVEAIGRAILKAHGEAK